MKRTFALPVFLLCLGCATTDIMGTEAETAAPPAISKEDQGEALAHYLTSIIYERAGLHDEAIDEMRRAADLSPASTDLRRRLTELQDRLLRVYLRDEDYEKAAVMVERSVRNEPGDVGLQNLLGRIYLQLERFDEATEVFERAIELDPSNVELQIRLGGTYLQLERYDEATQVFKRATELDPDNAVALEVLARIDEETNDLVGAIDVYEKMLDISPRSALLHYRLGLNLLELGDGEWALRELEQALTLNDELNTAHYMIAAIHLEQGAYESALDHYRRFLQGDPANVRARVNLAATRARMGHYDRAIDIITRVIEGPEVETQHHLYRAFLLLRRGTPARSSLAAAPNGAPLLGTLMQALVRKMVNEPYVPMIESLDTIEGDLDRECNVYLNDMVGLFGPDDGGEFLAGELRAVLEAGVRSKVMETVLARTLMSMERDAEAAEVLLEVIRRHGPGKWLHYYMAAVSDNLDRPDQTENHLRACLAYDPNDADVLNFLGYFLAEENKKLSEAEQLLERALQFEPESGFYLDSLGWVYYRQGKGAKAVEHIRRAIRAMSSDDAILRDHLGDAYRLEGDIEKAVAEWRRARRLDPDLEGVQEKIERYAPKIGE